MAGRPLQSFVVVRTRQLAPHMVRVVLGSSRFDTFVPSEFTDSYVKLVFVPDNVDMDGLPRPLTLDSFADLPPERMPSVRTMTVRHVDVAARELAVDIVVHGEHGIAGPWAAEAQPGQPIHLMGPGGAYAPTRPPTGICWPVMNRHCRPSRWRWKRCPPTQSVRRSSKWPALKTKSL